MVVFWPCLEVAMVPILLVLFRAHAGIKSAGMPKLASGG